MPDYRRLFRAVGTYFFTVVTYNRQEIFKHEIARFYLHKAIVEVRVSHPFEMPGIVLLPDHLHCIWKLPDGDDNFSMRWRMINSRFTKFWIAITGWEQPVSQSRSKRQEQGIWQRRFWEHLITDQQDFTRHMDYIHYNPVKHGYAECPHKWEYSSFHRWVKEGIYKRDWLCQCDGNSEQPDFKVISNSVGE